MLALTHLPSLLLLPLLSLLPNTQTHASPSPQDTDIDTDTAAPTAAATAATTIIIEQVTAAMTTITEAPSTVTTYIASATTPPSPQYTNDLTFRTSLLNSTNLYRYQHNASYLSWNDSLATYATNYAAKCIWAHSYGPPGENLARGYPDVTSAVDAWGNERALYSFSPPSNVTGFTEATGHFTQLVWKSTQTVGCGVYACNGQNGIAGYMLVCEYWPPGNIEGTGSEKNVFFDENVQGQVYQGEDGFNEFSATVGATGVGTATATGTLIPTGSHGGSASATSTGNIGVGREGWLDFGIGIVAFGVGLVGGL